MAGVGGAPLLLLTATQVVGSPGVWSSLPGLSFLGGQGGKRSTDESQELYPTGDDLAMAASYDTEYGDYPEYEAAEARVDPYRRRRKPYRRRRKPKLPPSQDFYAGDTVDRDTGYAAPGTGYGTPNAPAPSYSGGGGKDSFNDFLNALAAFLPIGLFLAAIPPNLIVINSTSRRRRSADGSEETMNSLDSPAFDRPFLRRMASLGPEVWRPECQAQLFCQMVEMGGEEEGNSIQKMLAAATALTPDFAAEMLGVREVFQASRQGDCSKFKCDQ